VPDPIAPPIAPPDAADVDDAITRALAEDIGEGDLTTRATAPAGTRLKLEMRARKPVVVCGIDIAREVFRRTVPEASFEALVADGTRVEAGTVLARLEGPAAGLLTGERTALNFVQMLSGIATLTRRFVDLTDGTKATVLDTRKTIPGLRTLSKFATRTGGARNHRLRLDDWYLIKDNHVAVAGSVGEATRRAIAAGTGKLVQVECDTLDQVAEAIEAGAESLLLDNMGLDELRQAVAFNGGRIPLEASGGVNLDTVRAIAETGVDLISIGAITQSAPAVDIGLDLAE